MNLHDPLELARAQYILELTNPTSFGNLYRLAKLERKINRLMSK